MDFTVDIEIEATPPAVWALLANLTRWPGWTDSITSVELLDGRLGYGARVRIAQPELRPMLWTVTRYEPGSAFTWTARVAGVTTDGSHEVQPPGEGRSRLRLGIHQRGMLAPMVGLLPARRGCFSGRPDVFISGNSGSISSHCSSLVSEG